MEDIDPWRSANSVAILINRSLRREKDSETIDDDKVREDRFEKETTKFDCCMCHAYPRESIQTFQRNR